VLELLVYPLLGSAQYTADYVESPGKLPSLVTDSVAEFARPEYGVDLLKLESPLAANSLPPRDGGAAAATAQGAFDAVGAICRQRGIPWVMLSGGAAPERFERVLDYAYAAGAGGFLAGRTIWLNAVRTHFPDLSATRAALQQESIAVLQRLNMMTGAKGQKWTGRFPAFDTIQAEGDFARAYGCPMGAAG
jgi:tagatose 1,6-diphosphate aldolase